MVHYKKTVIASSLCPFSSMDYLLGLSNLGNVDQHPDLPDAVISRRISGTHLFDGIGPWPYRWISDDSEIDFFKNGFRHLVSVSVITHPGWIPSPAIAKTSDIRKLKDHFVFDPDKPTPDLSRRARKRLAAADKRGNFEVITSMVDQLKIIAHYEQLKGHRNLTGGFFDMQESHFEAITRLPGAVFFRVSDGHDTGAMACGVVINNFLQILHLVPTQYGLSWNASYLMMYGLQQFAREKGLLLLTGGMPDNGAKGLLIFKKRWANAFLPVFMLCIINQEKIYQQLVSKLGFHQNYFPSYRNAKQL
jgi:hypothetical protein